MPWCPQCKNEYKAGIILCPDCNTELVDELDTDYTNYTIIAEIEDQSLADKLIQYLSYSGIKQAYYTYNEDSEVYGIFIGNDEIKEAVKYSQIFYEMEIGTESNSYDELPPSNEFTDNEPTEVMNNELFMEQPMNEAINTSDEFTEVSEDTQDNLDTTEFDDLELEEEQTEETDSYQPAKLTSSKKSMYVKKSEEYSELKSSGFMFLGFAIFGFGYIGLNLAGVLNLLNGVFSYSVVTILFTAFVVLGISSLIKSKKVFPQIAAENELTQHINEWLDQNFDVAKIDEPSWSSYSDELLFFYRINKTKKIIQKQMGEMNEAYLDLILEEYYNEHVA